MTASAVRTALVEGGRKVSSATVYRQLEKLALEGVVVKSQPIGEKSACFELLARHDRVRHHGTRPHEVLGRAPAEPAYRVVEMAHAVGSPRRATSSLIRSSSSLVM
ncbi:transcriptional repressor [Senegalimassilia anaerobia]|uniref:transcriptional repressor n=1 Tax=Senegalimassilia anaerobia TaxID=1473216 RepID=UPI00350E569C